MVADIAVQNSDPERRPRNCAASAKNAGNTFVERQLIHRHRLTYANRHTNSITKSLLTDPLLLKVRRADCALCGSSVSALSAYWVPLLLTWLPREKAGDLPVFG